MIKSPHDSVGNFSLLAVLASIFVRGPPVPGSLLRILASLSEVPVGIVYVFSESLVRRRTFFLIVTTQFDNWLIIQRCQLT